jgi:hypothetical protein
MPIHLLRRLLHTMSGTELSHVRTELERRRMRTTIPPHPVQANPQLPSHRYLGNALVPTHRQVNVPTSPLRIDSCRRLGPTMALETVLPTGGKTRGQLTKCTPFVARRQLPNILTH